MRRTRHSHPTLEEKAAEFQRLQRLTLEQQADKADPRMAILLLMTVSALMLVAVIILTGEPKL